MHVLYIDNEKGEITYPYSSRDIPFLLSCKSDLNAVANIAAAATSVTTALPGHESDADLVQLTWAHHIYVNTNADNEHIWQLGHSANKTFDFQWSIRV